MLRLHKKNYWKGILTSCALSLMMSSAFASQGSFPAPLWTFTPLTETNLVVPANASAIVQYRVTNQSIRTHTLKMQANKGVSQITSGSGVCENPFILPGKASCTLTLQINGSELEAPIYDSPIVCQQGSTNQCYRPAHANLLQITQGPAISDAIITVADSPLTLTIGGSSGILTITNASLVNTATNITSNFSGTALDGKVTEIGNTCANLAAGGSCTLTYAPGNAVVPLTNFTIQGTNTNALTAAISIESGSTLTSISPVSGSVLGGDFVVLSGTGFTNATSVTFGGVPATGLWVVNSTTATAVTPPNNTTGAVDVVINTPEGGATLTDGYAYLAPALGQQTGGGVIGCVNGGAGNLVIANTNNSNSISWGGYGISIGKDARSFIDGAENTEAIVTELTTNQGIPSSSYAAGICSNYVANSQGGNCKAGDICYDDWFLPAQDQLNCLYLNQASFGYFSSVLYWTSTESSGFFAWIQRVTDGLQFEGSKDSNLAVRCVRNFTY